MLMIMTEIEKTQFFDGKKIRTVWDDEKQEWFFSIKDVVSILAETSNAKDYIAKMRRRDSELSKGWGQIVHPLSIQTPDCNSFATPICCYDTLSILTFVPETTKPRI